jgi:NAD-dependent deacetylase
MATLAAVFVIGEALDAEIGRAAAAIAEARRVVALTGAGLSVESGIPPFRGPGGLWTKYGEPPMDGYRRFLADPAAAWRERLSPREPWAVGLRDTLARARPNAGHHALVVLERAGLLHAVITQNIDDLHGQAGTATLLEIHGNQRLLRCTECHTRFEPEALAVDPENLPPSCPHCAGIVKGDTVQFGEPIPPDVLRRCYEEVDRADCMLVVGTSATVYPAAEFPQEVLRRGGAVVEVNPEESELTPLATISVRGPAGAVLARLLHHLPGSDVREAAS